MLHNAPQAPHAPSRRRRVVLATTLAVALTSALAAACERTRADAPAPPADRGDASDSAGSVASRTPPALPVDSYLPPAESLRRFRAGLSAVTALAGGAPSRDALVRAFVRAVETRDTRAVNRLIVSRAEFAYVYYPTSPFRTPPYELDPQMAWFQLRTQSEKGISRLLDRFGGRPLGVVGYDCPSPPLRQGENRVWEGCTVRRVADGAAATGRLFGSILERGGRFKFLGYGNDF